ncbi:Proline dehydrogenase domain [Sesbania bispinosa]|nr:Proline dehydrogenase domain [Sesbania bispinosa]
MHNNGENPIVFGTIQTYLKDAKERLFLITEVADKMGVPMGFKLVRGAYMSTETKLAESLGYASPIHNTIQDTHNCFNDCSSFLLEKIANGPGSVVLATPTILNQVSKYMPFGPVEMVMPYLLRRAEENRGLLAASGFDRQLIRKELGRRLKAVF